MYDTEIIVIYHNIINKFIEFSNINIKKELVGEFRKLIIMKCLNILKYQFFLLLFRTNNIYEINNICEKSFIYYVEFINHIKDNVIENYELNIRDAIIFIYKKNLFNEYDKNNTILKSNEKFEKNKKISIILDIINNIYKLITINQCITNDIKVINIKITEFLINIMKYEYKFLEKINNNILEMNNDNTFKDNEIKDINKLLIDIEK